MAPTSREILRELSSIRTLVRRRLLAYGVCATLAGGGLSFLTVVTLDWLLNLPPLLRVFGATLFVIGFGLATLNWIVRPLQTRFTLAQIAAKLEQHYPGLNDRLSSTVSFLTTRTDASPALMRQVVTNTNRIVARLQLQNALTVRPLLIQACLLVLVFVTLLTIVVASPQWVTVGVQRYARPFDGVQWPRDVEIQHSRRTVKVAIGDSTTLRMRVIRGGHADLRGVVHLLDKQGHKTVLAMHRDDNNEYRCEIDAISSDLSYWFKAGDDDTRKSPGRIEVVRRPAVSKAIATIHPPSYADHAAVIVADMSAGPIAAVVGGAVEVHLRSTKPIRTDAGARPEAWLEIDGGKKLPLSFADGGFRFLKTTLSPIEESVSFRAHLVDRDGLANRGGRVYQIEAKPDRPPTVVLLEPQRVFETTPRGAVAILARAQDDFGLKGLRLVGHDVDSGQLVDFPLLADARVTLTNERVTAVVEYLWKIERLNLNPPATVIYRIEAIDNFACTGGQAASGTPCGQVGASTRARIKVISELEFERRLRDEFASLQKRIRRAWLEQEIVKDETTRMRESLLGGAAPEGDQGGSPKAEGLSSRNLDEEVLKLSDRQERLARRLIDLSQRSAWLRRRMELNHSSDAESIELTSRLQAELTDTAGGPMRQAVHALDSAAREAPTYTSVPDRDTASFRVDLLAEAVDRQKAAAKTLRDILRQMDHWGDFRSLVTKTRDLIDRQQRLRTQTTELGRRTIGQRRAELSEALQGELRQLRRRQGQLAEELETLLNRLRNTSKPTYGNSWAATLRPASEKSSEPSRGISASAAAAMENALRAAIAGEVAQRMLDASDAIQTNRLAGAGVHQRSARQGLSKMLAHLEEREVRRLAELAKLAEDALRAVAHLLAEQEELLAATHEAITVASENRVFVSQSSQQGRLEQNAYELGKDLGESVDTADAGDLVRQAARIMTRAKQALSDARGSEANQAQEDAVDRLRDATNLLEERARKAAHAASQKLMAAMRTRLEDVRGRQRGINDNTSKVIDSVAAKGRLERATARRAAKLARSQTTLRQTTEQLRKTLARTVVYDRVLKSVVGGMQTSRESLQTRQLNRALRSVQKRIVRRLDQLIRALLEAQALPPPDEFAGGGIGGAGGAGAGSQPPIPTAAELLMIKTMQTYLLAETNELALASSAGVEPSEDQLSTIETLGKRQRELRELTELLVKEVTRRR